MGLHMQRNALTKGVDMITINKPELLCCAFSLISITGHAMEVVNPMDCLAKADQITLLDSDEEKTLIAEKCDAYEKLAQKDSREGIQAQLFMAIVWHNGLFGYDKSTYKAIPYWTALANQADIPALRVLGLEMVGVYHQEGWQSIKAEVKPDLLQAKAYFTRAIAAYKENDPECKKDTQTIPRLHEQIQAIIKATNNR
jgi:hypothetical protein